MESQTPQKMDATEALALLRADLMPANIRMYCAAKSGDLSRLTADSLGDLADELSTGPGGPDGPDYAAAFRAISFIVGSGRGQLRDIGDALACAFGAPTHAMTWAPYCAIVDGCLGPGALTTLLAEVSFYTPYYSASCAPSGRLLEQLEALLTDAVVVSLLPSV